MLFRTQMENVRITLKPWTGKAGDAYHSDATTLNLGSQRGLNMLCLRSAYILLLLFSTWLGGRFQSIKLRWNFVVRFIEAWVKWVGLSSKIDCKVLAPSGYCNPGSFVTPLQPPTVIVLFPLQRRPETIQKGLILTDLSTVLFLEIIICCWFKNLRKSHKKKPSQVFGT